MPKVSTALRRVSSRTISSQRTASKPERTRTSSTSQPIFTRIISFFKKFLLFLFLVLIVFGMTTVAYYVSQSKWDQSRRLNIILIQENSESPSITLISLDGKQTQVIILPLWDSLELNVLNQRGTVNVGRLAQMVRDDQFHDVRSIVAFHFGFIADGWLIVDQESVVTDLATMKNLLNIETMWNAKSNLVLSDRIKVWNFIQNLRSAQARIVSSDSITDMNSGSTQINFAKVSTNFASFLSTIEIQKEQLSIAVVNTTQLKGFATRIGNVLSHVGFRIINISNSQQEQIERTTLYLSAEVLQNEVALEKIKELFPFEIIIQEDESILQTYRSNMVLLLGTDTVYFQTE